MRVSSTMAMIAGMDPELQPGEWHFCTLSGDLAERFSAKALATVREPEGLSLILSETDAEAAGLVSDLPMAHIVLKVHSALDGVGLTAAVAAKLAEAGLPCNVVAGHHHDHVFVPVLDGPRAVSLLRSLADKSRH